MLKSRKSYFAGKSVKLDDISAPVLYPRYVDPESVIEDGIAGRKRKEEPMQAINKYEIVEDFIRQEEPKKARKKERWSEEKKAAAKAERDSKTDSLGTKKKKKKKKSDDIKLKEITKSDVVSGPGNTEEAEAMRSALGITNGEAVAPSFQFGFTSITSQERPTIADSSDRHLSSESSDTSSGQSASKSDSSNSSDNVSSDAEEKKGDQKSQQGLLSTEDGENNNAIDSDGYIPRRIFVGGMPFGYTEDMVREYWEYCGPIESLNLMVFPDTGRFKGIAFITFATQAGYESALECNGADCDGQIIKVDRCKADTKKNSFPRARSENISKGTALHADDMSASARPPAPKTEGYNVAYVGNIAFEATPENIQAIFEPCGVTLVRLHTDKDTGRPKGYAHVHFKDEESLDKALSLNGTPLMGRKLKVGYAQPKKK